MALFGPIALPLVGRVGDCGEFESLVEDFHTAILRAKLGGSLEDFLEGCARGGTHAVIQKLAKNLARSEKGSEFYRNLRWNGSLSGCWVAKEAWDHFSTHSWEETGKSRYSVWDSGWLDPYHLKGMGFVKGAESKGEAQRVFGSQEGDRYKTPWTHQGIPDLTIWCDQFMSSLVSYRGKKLEVGFTVKDFALALGKASLALPQNSEEWAKRTSVYRTSILQAKKDYLKHRRASREREECLRKDPQGHFTLISDDTPEEVREARKERMQWTVANFLKRRKGEETNEEGEPQVPEVTATLNQVFCDRRWHVHLQVKPGSDPRVLTMDPCDPKTPHDHLWDSVDFTPSVWEDLANRGWKAPKVFRSFRADPVFRGFPQETLMLYGRDLFQERLFPHLEAFFTFASNLYAANRILTPTPSGWQSGNPATQYEVAKMAAKLSKRDLSQRRTWDRG
jgi:hypothetical protein